MVGYIRKGYSGRRRHLTPEQIVQAIELRTTRFAGKNKRPWGARRIAQHMGVSPVAVTRALDLPVHGNVTELWSDEYRELMHRLQLGNEARPPEYVLAERDQRINTPHESIGAALMGDPPVGYSARDRG